MECWDAGKTQSNGGLESLDDDGDIWLMWSVKDCAEATFCVCETCKVLQVVHKCGDDMQMMGHHGYHASGKQYRRDHVTGMKSEISKPAKYDANTPRFNISDLDQHKVRLDEWRIIGPNKDQKHFWHCATCCKTCQFGL